MARYQIVMPPKQLAEAFTARTSLIVERIIHSIHETRTLRALREALLPKLISGDLRLRDAERLIESAM